MNYELRITNYESIETVHGVNNSSLSLREHTSCDGPGVRAVLAGMLLVVSMTFAGCTPETAPEPENAVENTESGISEASESSERPAEEANPEAPEEQQPETPAEVETVTGPPVLARKMYRATNIASTGEPGVGFGGLCVSDVDPRYDGPEVIAVSDIGQVVVAHRVVAHGVSGGLWAQEEVYRSPEKGELIMVDAGRLFPEKNLSVIVAVGMKSGPESDTGEGVAIGLWFESDSWRHEIFAEDERMLHGVAIGNFDASRAGDELCVMGFSGKVFQVFPGTEIPKEVIYEAPSSKIKVGAVEDVSEESASEEELLVAASDGLVVMLDRGLGGEWAKSIVASTPDSPMARVAVKRGLMRGGEKIASLFGDDYGNVYMSYYNAGEAGGSWSMEPFALPPADTDASGAKTKIRGVAIGDFDRTSPGMELASAGYSKLVRVLGSPGGWTIVWEDSAPLHFLLAADLDQTNDTIELVTTGHSGRVTMLAAP
ncbi:MAG: hypothetical protein NUW37_17170 [Planctomycetes bacterium]|nr:hypothetical protein [Planctomycetota bacterium]